MENINVKPNYTNKKPRENSDGQKIKNLLEYIKENDPNVKKINKEYFETVEKRSENYLEKSDPNAKIINIKQNKKYSESTKKKIKSALKFNKSYTKLKLILVDLCELAKEKNRKSNRGRPSKYPIPFYVSRVMLMLYRGCTWDDIASERVCCESSIRKFFYFMVEGGIISTAYEIVQRCYNLNRKFKFVSIDSASLINKNSSLFAAYYQKIKSKKQIKLSIICDKNKVPLVHQFNKGSASDVKIAKELIKKLDPNFLANKGQINGDKGYILKNQYFIFNEITGKWRQCKKYNNKNKNNKRKKIFKVVTPKRKNQKTVNTEEEEKGLKKRCEVENSFCRIKRSFKKLDSIYDRKSSILNTYLQLVSIHTMLDHINIS
jgi:hypothetical protein